MRDIDRWLRKSAEGMIAYAAVLDRILEFATSPAPPDAYAPSAEDREDLRWMLREGLQ